MNTNADFVGFLAKRKPGLRLAVGLLALLTSLPLIYAQRGGAPRGGGGGGARPVAVDRSSHGSIRHAETQVVQRPAEVSHAPARPAETYRAPERPQERPQERPVEVHHDVAPGRGFQVHHDVDVDIHAHHFWNDFSYRHHWGALPLGYFAFSLGGTPYYYDDGIYYQAANGGYDEVYPPVGAGVPQLPDGAIEIDGNGQTYYYAGGAFYVQQPDGTFVTVPPPIGVVVPELPPGAAPVTLNGTVAYQFNGVYYEPVFVNGVTQYETVAP
jgi:hypothetical protein